MPQGNPLGYLLDPFGSHGTPDELAVHQAMQVLEADRLLGRVRDPKAYSSPAMAEALRRLNMATQQSGRMLSGAEVQAGQFPGPMQQPGAAAPSANSLAEEELRRRRALGGVSPDTR